MRALEVVCVDVQAQTSLAIAVVAEDRAREKLLPQRLPETLHLAQRLRVLRPALDVTDALTPQLLLEVRFAAPRRVLPPLVGQDLARRAPRRDGSLQRFHHQARSLVVRHRPAHQEARVVVHEGRHVEALVASQQEGEDVRLPHLVGRSAFEAPRRMVARRCRRRCLVDESRLVQDATHLRLAHAQRREARQHVADASRAPVGMLATLLDHRLMLHLRAVRARLLCRCSRTPRHQRVHPSLLVGPDPVDDRGHARTEDPRELVQARRPAHRLLDHPQTQRQRVGPTATCQLLRAAAALVGGSTATTAFLALAHTVSPFLFSVSGRKGGTVLGDFELAQTLINWRAAQATAGWHLLRARRLNKFTAIEGDRQDLSGMIYDSCGGRERRSQEVALAGAHDGRARAKALGRHRG